MPVVAKKKASNRNSVQHIKTQLVTSLMISQQNNRIEAAATAVGGAGKAMRVPFKAAACCDAVGKNATCLDHLKQPPRCLALMPKAPADLRKVLPKIVLRVHLPDICPSDQAPTSATNPSAKEAKFQPYSPLSHISLDAFPLAQDAFLDSGFCSAPESKWSIADLEQLVEEISGLKQSAAALSKSASEKLDHFCSDLGRPLPAVAAAGPGSAVGGEETLGRRRSAQVAESTFPRKVKKDGQHMKKRKVGDLVSGGGSSSSDECTEAQAIELARTLKPDDAMRVRANDVKGAEFWGALESVFRPFEGRDLDFLRTSATLDEDSAMRVPPIQRFSLSTKKDAKGKTKVLKLVSAPKEPPTVFDMAPVWFRLCCALVDNPKEDAVQTLRDMNRVSNVGINMSPSDLNIGALASLQGIDAVSKSWTYSKSNRMDDEVCAELMFMQAQLKETIEKYGPVRQPVRETTLKILRSEYSECFRSLRTVADQLTAMMKQSGQGVRASVRPDEALRKVKEWQDNFKAYQTALQRLSAAPLVSAVTLSSASAVPTNSVAIPAESAAADVVPLSSSKELLCIAAESST